MTECSRPIPRQESDRQLSHDTGPSGSREGGASQSLEQLLAEIAEDSLHEEIGFGPVQGNEMW